MKKVLSIFCLLLFLIPFFSFNNIKIYAEGSNINNIENVNSSNLTSAEEILNSYRKKIDSLNIKKSKKDIYKQDLTNKLNFYKTGVDSFEEFKIEVEKVYQEALEEQKEYENNIKNATICLIVFSVVFLISILLYLLIIYGIRKTKKLKNNQKF